MGTFRVTVHDSRDLGFAHACLLSAAISQEEFNSWVYWVIEKSHEELPTYFFDLCDLDDRVGALYEAVGFVPSSGLNDEEDNAVSGIAFKRGAYDHPVSYDLHIDRDAALKALAENPQVEQRFRDTFPFIELPD